jgi:hypothetical protein
MVFGLRTFKMFSPIVYSIMRGGSDLINRDNHQPDLLFLYGSYRERMQPARLTLLPPGGDRHQMNGSFKLQSNLGQFLKLHCTLLPSFAKFRRNVSHDCRSSQSRVRREINIPVRTYTVRLRHLRKLPARNFSTLLSDSEATPAVAE